MERLCNALLALPHPKGGHLVDGVCEDCGKLHPTPGHVVELDELPACDMCGAVAVWDAPTTMGPWAYMCRRCAAELALHYPKTGVGIGQRLVARSR